MNMFSPIVELRVGNTIRVRNQFQVFDLWLSRQEPSDVCQFTLKLGLPLDIKKDQPIEIWMGYELDQVASVFSGYATEARSPNYLCKDEMARLFDIPVVQTFVNVDPQDVIRYALQKAGVAKQRLDPARYPRKPLFVAAGENVSDLVRRVNTTWGLNNDWYFQGETFCWDQPVPAGPVYSYKYGENIIDLEFSTDRETSGQRAAGKASGGGKLLTVLSPFVAHSQEIEVIWPEVKDARYLVETVRHFLNDKGSWRTELYFRELEGS